MADDRMRNDDDLDRKMGGGGQRNKDEFGQQQTPGRNKQDDDLSTGQRGTRQDQHNEPGHFEDDFGTSGESDKSGFGQGGQNR